MRYSALTMGFVPAPTNPLPLMSRMYATTFQRPETPFPSIMPPASIGTAPMRTKYVSRSWLARSAIRRARTSMLTSSSVRALPSPSASRIRKSCNSASRSELRRATSHDAAAHSTATTMAPTPSHSENVMNARYSR